MPQVGRDLDMASVEELEKLLANVRATNRAIAQSVNVAFYGWVQFYRDRGYPMAAAAELAIKELNKCAK